MKEISIEEKAKAYDEAINRAKKLKETCYSTVVIGWCEYIFPELKESKDEKIRKMLIRFHKSTIDIDGIKGADIVAWLEKQGEQKPAELAKGEDYGIDGLWHAQRILEKTFGKVDGYQTDDGILSHECAISAVKELYEKKPSWSKEDEENLQGILDEIEANKSSAPDYDLETYDRFLSWLESLKQRIGV